MTRLPTPLFAAAALALVVTGWPTSLAAQEPTAYDVVPAEIRLPAQGCSFPIGTYRGRPTVEIEINGKGPFLFMVDTGASTNVFNADLAKELGLPVTGKSRLGDPTDPTAIEVDLVNVETVTVGGATFERLGASSWDRSALYPDPETMPRGFLGFPFFARCLLTMEIGNEVFRLKQGELTADAPHTVEYGLWHGVSDIPMVLAGKPVTTHIDTGFGGGIMLPTKWMKTLSYGDEPKVIGRGRTVNSEFDISRATLDGVVTIAGHELENPQLLFTEVMDAIDRANIGSGLMKDYAVTFDQKNRRVQFLPVTLDAEAADAAKPKEPLGLQVQFSSGAVQSVEIAAVTDGSLAAKAGVQGGDVILAVNGTDIADLERSQLGTEFGRDRVRLKVRRGDATHEITILRD